MDVIPQFLQTYGIWLALGGGILFMATRSGGMGGCCGMLRQGRDQTAGAYDTADRTGHPPTTVELRMRIAEMQAQQEIFARQIASLAGESADVGRTDEAEPARATSHGGTGAVR